MINTTTTKWLVCEILYISSAISTVHGLVYAIFYYQVLTVCHISWITVDCYNIGYPQKLILFYSTVQNIIFSIIKYSVAHSSWKFPRWVGWVIISKWTVLMWYLLVVYIALFNQKQYHCQWNCPSAITSSILWTPRHYGWQTSGETNTCYHFSPCLFKNRQVYHS